MTFVSQHLLTLKTRCRSSLSICELPKRMARSSLSFRQVVREGRLPVSASTKSCEKIGFFAQHSATVAAKSRSRLGTSQVLRQSRLSLLSIYQLPRQDPFLLAGLANCCEKIRSSSQHLPTVDAKSAFFPLHSSTAERRSVPSRKTCQLLREDWLLLSAFANC